MTTREEAQAASERWRRHFHPQSPEFVAQWKAFQEARAIRPDLIPYVGPSDALLDFMNGDVVTAEQMAHDESKWVCIAMAPAVIVRMHSMLSPPDTPVTGTS